MDTGDETQTGGRLKRAAPYLDAEEAFCLTYGDGVSDVNITKLIEFHRAYGLQAIPRADKTLCDAVEIFSKRIALRYLQAGIRKGLVSIQTRGDFPQNIWAVTDSGNPLEAQLENPVQGTYHGYPMPETDPFRQAVLRRWQAPQ